MKRTILASILAAVIIASTSAYVARATMPNPAMLGPAPTDATLVVTADGSVYDPDIDPTAAMGGGADATMPLWLKVNPSDLDCYVLTEMVDMGQLAPEAVDAPAPCSKRR